MSPVRVRYQSMEYPGFDIHVRTLWDRDQFSDDEGVAEALGISSAAWPLFGNLWPAGQELARLMAVGVYPGLRILEVGCGIGLPSLVLNHRGLDITASDHHPSAQGFLDINSALNDDARIPFERANWTETSALGEFDLIIGADLLYDPHQIDALAEFLRRHCRAGGGVIIVDPGRKMRGRFCSRMTALGFSCERASVPPELQNGMRAGEVLRFALP